jgi:hypothetical protein
VSIKNAVFCDVASLASCKIRRFEGNVSPKHRALEDTDGPTSQKSAIWSWSWIYDRQSSSLSRCHAPICNPWPDMSSVWHMWVSWCGAPSLTRGRVCNLLLPLVLASAVLGSESRWTRLFYFPSSWDSPNLEVQVRWGRWGYFTTDGQSGSLAIEHPCETCAQILLPVGMLLSEICSLVSVGRPLWREDGSAICSAISQ